MPDEEVDKLTCTCKFICFIFSCKGECGCSAYSYSYMDYLESQGG